MGLVTKSDWVQFGRVIQFIEVGDLSYKFFPRESESLTDLLELGMGIIEL